jgi:hypothetical protein
VVGLNKSDIRKAAEVFNFFQAIRDSFFKINVLQVALQKAIGISFPYRWLRPHAKPFKRLRKSA